MNPASVADTLASVVLLGLVDLRSPRAVASLRAGVAGIELLGETSKAEAIALRRRLGDADPSSIVATSWSRCDSLLDEPKPEPGFLGWELSEGGQPLEVLLSALGFGKALAAAGCNLIFGPSLELGSDLSSSFGRRPDGVGRVAGLFVEGLSTAGLTACAGVFDGGWIEDHAEDAALPYGALGQKGARAFTARPNTGAAKGLRGELGWDGVLVNDEPLTDADPLDRTVELLRQGFDLIRVADEGAVDRLLQEGAARIEAESLGDRLREASERVGRLRAQLG